MQKIVPNLWFDADAEEAVSFYLSVFEDSRVIAVSRYGPSGPGEPGTVMSIEFELDGQEFVAVNAGARLPFAPTVSFAVVRNNQDEIDELWSKLSAGGETGRCGWLRDRYGLSWQVVPSILAELVSDTDAARAARTTEALLGMSKLDIAALRRAHDQL